MKEREKKVKEMEMYAICIFIFIPSEYAKLSNAQQNTIIKNGKNKNEHFHSVSFIILNKSQESPWQNDKWICQVVDAHFNGCSRFFFHFVSKMNGIYSFWLHLSPG